MSDKKVRGVAADNRLIDTVDALIELYKEAFGDNWQRMFVRTVKVNAKEK